MDDIKPIEQEADQFEDAAEQFQFKNDLGFDEQLSLDAKIEAILFASSGPMKSKDIFDLLVQFEEPIPVEDIEKSLNALVNEYRNRAGGFRLEMVPKQGFQFRTVPAASELMKLIFSSRPRPLSRAALETLAIVAYRQPVTRADIEFIRGVDSGSIVKNLLERNLIACVGRKEEAGRPMVFGTTQEFLTVFRLSGLEELPPLASFQASAEIISAANKKLEDLRPDVDIGEIVSGEISSGEVIT